MAEKCLFGHVVPVAIAFVTRLKGEHMYGFGLETGTGPGNQSGGRTV